MNRCKVIPIKKGTCFLDGWWFLLINCLAGLAFLGCDRSSTASMVPEEHSQKHSEIADSAENSRMLEEQEMMKTMMSISGIIESNGRTLIWGHVFSGQMDVGDQLEAVGLRKASCTVLAVKVEGESPGAVAGENVDIYVSSDSAEIQPEDEKTYFALLTPGTATLGTRFNAMLQWNSIEERAFSDGPGAAFPVKAITKDEEVFLTFGHVEVEATLIRKPEVLPLGPVEEWTIDLERPIPLLPGYSFLLRLKSNPEATALGTLLPNKSP